MHRHFTEGDIYMMTKHIKTVQYYHPLKKSKLKSSKDITKLLEKLNEK